MSESGALTAKERKRASAALVAEVIAATGLVSLERLGEAVRAAGTGSLAEVIAETVGGPEELAQARAAQYGLSFIDLSGVGIQADAVEALPIDVLKRVVAIPYLKTASILKVAIADPGDIRALDELRLASRLTLAFAVALREDIESELQKVARAAEATERSSLMDLEFPNEEEEEEEEFDEAPIAKLFNSVLQQAAADGASDVHLNPTPRGLIVRFRVDGVLSEVQAIPRRLANSLTTLIKVTAKLDIAERRKPQDGRISLRAKNIGKDLDVRVAIVPTVEGEATVMRLLDTSTEPPTLDALGFKPTVQEKFKDIVTRPTGALLVTGPTGSGKSTTLYATLAEIHRPEINVITVEDPVEYRLSGVNQIQVNARAGLTFATALRSILRADPDIIMVGEVRDLETAKISIESALTGHLVLSTLHTNDAPSAVTRLTEMGVEPFLVGAAVSGVIAQRLARKLCENCKRQYTPTQEELGAAKVDSANAHLFGAIFQPEGCARCGKTGYKGRVGIYQLMVMSDELVRVASRGATRDEIAAIATSEGMQTLWDAGLDLVSAGITSFEELRRVVQ